jgi:hypothetical protein
MITRAFSHYADRACTAASLARGRSLSLPHPSSVSDHPKANMARQLVLAFARSEAMTGATIAVQALNPDRMSVAAADRGLIAGVQRP